MWNLRLGAKRRFHIALEQQVLLDIYFTIFINIVMSR